MLVQEGLNPAETPITSVFNHLSHYMEMVDMVNHFTTAETQKDEWWEA